MSLIKAKCIEYDEIRPICTASEEGKTYRLENESRFKIKRVKVDGCIDQKEEGVRICDYLFIINDKKVRRAIFVEFKGGALTDALKQLFSTIRLLKHEFKGYRLDARIVGTRDVPKFVNTLDYRKLAREINFPVGTIERATNGILSEKI